MTTGGGGEGATQHHQPGLPPRLRDLRLWVCYLPAPRCGEGPGSETQERRLRAVSSRHGLQVHNGPGRPATWMESGGSLEWGGEKKGGPCPGPPPLLPPAGKPATSARRAVCSVGGQSTGTREEPPPFLLLPLVAPRPRPAPGLSYLHKGAGPWTLLGAAGSWPGDPAPSPARPVAGPAVWMWGQEGSGEGAVLDGDRAPGPVSGSLSPQNAL